MIIYEVYTYNSKLQIREVIVNDIDENSIYVGHNNVKMDRNGAYSKYFETKSQAKQYKINELQKQIYELQEEINKLRNGSNIKKRSNRIY